MYTHVSDHGKSDEERDDTDDSDEHFTSVSFTEECGEGVHAGRHKTLNANKLWVKSQQNNDSLQGEYKKLTNNNFHEASFDDK